MDGVTKGPPIAPDLPRAEASGAGDPHAAPVPAGASGAEAAPSRASGEDAAPAGASRADPGRAPGRPRSARADEAIIAAVLDLLQDGVAVDALSIEAVASRAGVGKATIYRRWPNKEALILDAVRSLKGDAVQPAGGSVRDDLVALLSAVARPRDGRALRVLPCLVPEMHRNPVQHRLYQEIIEPRREVVREVLRRGIRTGELRPDIDIEVTLSLLIGPILVQKLLRWNPALDDATLPARVVDSVLAGIGS